MEKDFKFSKGYGKKNAGEELIQKTFSLRDTFTPLDKINDQ